MIRLLCLVVFLFVGSAQAQTITHQPSAPMLFGSGPPSVERGISNQTYYDVAGHKMWQRTTIGWTQLGSFNAPTDADITATAVPSLLTGKFYLGAVYDGMEAGNIPGVAGTDYFLPTSSDFDYLKSRGLMIIRLPIRWERLQPTLSAALDPTYLGQITAAITMAASKGMGIILDLHCYGHYGSTDIGTSSVPISSFADVWSRLAQTYVNQPGLIGYDLMNEPVDLGSNLQPASQAAVNAIRAFDTSHPILVEGDGYTSAGQWTASPENAALAINDPAAKLIYQAHNYLDCDSSGTHFNWIDQSTDPTKETGGTSCTTSQTVTVNTGVQRATVFVQWCQQHGYRCMIGELGAGMDNPAWLTALDNELSYLRQNNVGVTYFAAGADFQIYPMGIEPQQPGQQPGNLVDAPQMGVLMKYSGFTSVPYAIFGPRSGSAGQASSAFTVVTNGYVSAATTVTPSDGGAGGTFTPASVTLPAGFGGSATFTYTASSSAVFTIGASASNPAWGFQGAVAYSTVPDLLATIGAGSKAVPLTLLSATSAINTAFVGQPLTLRRGSDNAVRSFGFVNGSIDTASIASWAGNTTVYLHNLTDQAPNVTNALTPVANNADEPAWSATALNGHPGYLLNNSRLQTNSSIGGLNAATMVATLYLPAGNQCGRLMSFTSGNVEWMLPGGNSDWWDETADSPAINVGAIETTKPHVLVLRWQGQGTGSGQHDLFVDGINVSSVPTTIATLPPYNSSNGTGMAPKLTLGYFIYYSPCSTNGVIGDLMVFKGALTNAEVSAVTSYEKGKFGL